MNNCRKLLIYSDCYIYGGSERLISFLVRNPIIIEQFKIVFVYRFHKLYQNAIKNEYREDKMINILYPIPILSNATLFYKIDLLDIPASLKKLFKIPFFILDNSGFFFIYNLIIQLYILIKFSPDIVHINNGGYPGASSCSTMVFASKIAGIEKVVYQINNTTFRRRNLFSKYFDRYINKYVNCFITASKHAKEKLVTYRNFDVEKIIQVQNTILEESVTESREKILNNLHISQTNFVICNVGFLLKSKWQKYLLEAFHLVSLWDPLVFKQISLFIVGNGEEEINLKKYSELLRINDKIHFLGYQRHSINYIDCCDLFVFPSIGDEDMPLVILSAMKLGKAIIATDFAGIREEIEDRISGILISPNTEFLSQSLAQKIIELYYNRNEEMGQNAKERYSRFFSNSVYSSAILNIYNSLVSTKKL